MAIHCRWFTVVAIGLILAFLNRRHVSAGISTLHLQYCTACLPVCDQRFRGVINGAVRLIARGVRVCFWRAGWSCGRPRSEVRWSPSRRSTLAPSCCRRWGQQSKTWGMLWVMCYVYFYSHSVAMARQYSTYSCIELKSEGRWMYLSLSHPRCVCMLTGRI